MTNGFLRTNASCSSFAFKATLRFYFFFNTSIVESNCRSSSVKTHSTSVKKQVMCTEQILTNKCIHSLFTAIPKGLTGNAIPRFNVTRKVFPRDARVQTRVRTGDVNRLLYGSNSCMPTITWATVNLSLIIKRDGRELVSSRCFCLDSTVSKTVVISRNRGEWFSGIDKIWNVRFPKNPHRNPSPTSNLLYENALFVWISSPRVILPANPS